MPKLFDVHTHVHFAAFEDDYKEVIKRALDNDTWLVNVGTQKDTSAKAIKVAEGYEEGVYATIGLHPIHTEQSYHDVKELGDHEAAKEFTSRGEAFDYDTYLKLGQSNKVVAIGECGLDYYRLGEDSKKKQEIAFISQMQLAKELGKPLMIHCRDAFHDLIKILRREESKLVEPYPGIVHFFTGTDKDAMELKELGFYFSFGGVTTFARDYDPAIKVIDLDRILLETDAPYVAPLPFRGKRNEPAYVKYVAQKVAEILGTDFETVAAVTTANAKRVLRI